MVLEERGGGMWVLFVAASGFLLATAIEVADSIERRSGWQRFTAKSLVVVLAFALAILGYGMAGAEREKRVGEAYRVGYAEGCTRGLAAAAGVNEPLFDVEGER